jgi:hypothetical protein
LQVKRLIKALESARGNGTSMISLILPPKDQASTAAAVCVLQLALYVWRSAASAAAAAGVVCNSMISLILPPKDQASTAVVQRCMFGIAQQQKQQQEQVHYGGHDQPHPATQGSGKYSLRCVLV